MTETIRPAKIVTARKEYDCMSYEWLREMDSLQGITFTERRAIVAARNNRGKIFNGQKYHFSVMKFEGKIFSFRAIPEMHAIMIRLDWYVDC